MASLGALGILFPRGIGAYDQYSLTSGLRLKLNEFPEAKLKNVHSVCLAKKTASSPAFPSPPPPQQATNEVEVEEDIILEGLNELANNALQVMLGKKSKSIDDCFEDLEEAGEYLVKEGKLDAARFLLVIKHMLDHRMIPEKDELEGPYKKAFDKIWSCVEDSGWSLAMPKNEDGVDLLDDELIPPVLNQLPTV